MYTSTLNTIISAVCSRCNKLSIDLENSVDLYNYYNCTEWYTLLEFCINLDTRVQYFLTDDRSTGSKEQDHYSELLRLNTTEYIDWLRNYILSTYGTNMNAEVTIIDRIGSTQKCIVEKAKYKYSIIAVKKYRTYTNYTILHEYIVGRLINDMMQESGINSFVHTIGYRDDALYLEYINDADQLNEIIFELSREQIESCIIQVLFSIYYAFCTIGFIHRDLSKYNIMVTRYYTKNGTEIPVMIPDTDGTFTRHYLRTDVEVKIIDLGHSSVTLPNKQDFRLISYMSPHTGYEHVSNDISGISPANDIMYFISTLLTCGRSDIIRKGLMAGIIRMIYMLYTGTVLDNPDHNYVDRFMPDILQTNPNLHMTSPLLGPLHVREAILQYYSDSNIIIDGLAK